MSMEQCIFVVDDDEDVRQSLTWLFESINKPVLVFSTAQAFLNSYPPTQPGCLISDIRLPDISGIQLQQELVNRSWLLPVIFITAYVDIPIAIEAIKAGAIDFLVKPFNDQKLLDLVNKGLVEDTRRRKQDYERQALTAKMERLTPREIEVVNLVLSGHINKYIAEALQISCKTVELHRGNAMKKLGVKTVVDLVNLFHKYQTIRQTTPTMVE